MVFAMMYVVISMSMVFMVGLLVYFVWFLYCFCAMASAICADDIIMWAVRGMGRLVRSFLPLSPLPFRATSVSLMV